MGLRDRVRDEAIAIAKSYSHDQVEPRHVLWGLLSVLGDKSPPSVSRREVRGLLDPAGSSIATPTFTEGVEHELDGVASEAGAIAACSALADRLLSDPVRGAQATAVAEETKEAQRVGTAAERETEPSSSAEALAPILAELDALIGLESAKRSVRRLIAVQRMNAERRRSGLPAVNASSHVVFTGHPGTGKTTVARIVARLYGAIGVVSRGHLIEASRADLVAGYVGQTALKVQSVVDRALGGVLFIDEAYALTQGEGSDYGGEAIATLVKLMEDHRDDLAVIVAGYPAEMRAFIASNPGLRSRFTHHVEFDDYDTDQLVRIFTAIAANGQVHLTPEAMVRLPALFSEARKIGNFGNARFARSVFEIAYANMAHRALEDDRIEPDELHELTLIDLPVVERDGSSNEPRIGFRPR